MSIKERLYTREGGKLIEKGFEGQKQEGGRRDRKVTGILQGDKKG